MQLEIFADYHQFYLQDDSEEWGNLSNSWDQESVARLLAVAPHTVGIGTLRNNKVPVFIEILENKPTLSIREWDQIIEAPLQIDTGRIVVAGCTDYFPDALRLHVAPGHYSVLVCYKNLNGIADNGIENKDEYHVWIYPNASKDVEVMKIN